MDGMTNDDARQHLAYKVIELATVDEASLEEAVNTWVQRGWRLENVQFAMRESSRRPSMAFVFFTRELPAVASRDGDVADAAASPPDALARLRRLSERGATAHVATASDAVSRPLAVSAHERLRQLAGEDDEGEGG